MNKQFNLEEAENFIDNIYQHKFDDMEETLEDGTQVVHLDGLDNIKFTDFESASFTLLRGEQRLKQQVKKQKEVIDKIESLIKSKDNGTCIHNNERRGAYTFVLDFDEAREFVWNLEDILKEVSE